MKNVIVTGASRGIGKAIAIELARRGYRVALNYKNSEKEAEAIMEKINNSEIFKGEAYIYKADVSKYDEVKKMVDNFAGKFGKIYGLVANAGIYIRKDIWEMSIEDWHRTMDVNLSGAFYLVKASLPYISQGSIVFISSQLAFKGSPSSVAYSASKAGILGLMRSLALQLAPNIRVNAVAPGTIDTDMIANYTPDKRKKRENEIPLKRIGKPEDVAHVVSFLLSEESSYITGATLDVNGGLYIR